MLSRACLVCTGLQGGPDVPATWNAHCGYLDSPVFNPILILSPLKMVVPGLEPSPSAATTVHALG